MLPMGHSGERHDLMSQETHAGQWLAFRQPVRRVAMERLGQHVEFTYEANPGEVWEENELWIELSVRMDPDGSLGVRQWFESPEDSITYLSVKDFEIFARDVLHAKIEMEFPISSRFGKVIVSTPFRNSAATCWSSIRLVHASGEST